MTATRGVSSRRPSSPPVSRPAAAVPAAPPPLRLRYLLVAAALGLSVWGAVPRARAAWQLPSAATGLADYALCMVGPTGPASIRDNPTAFDELVRRRLITSGADDQPFARCAKGALELTTDGRTERAHRASAWQFVEWGGPKTGDAHTLADLKVSTRRLATLAEAAWPFVRGGYTSRVEPSAYAAEAPHPVALPVPGRARGAVTPDAVLSGGRCETGGTGAFVLGFSADRSHRVARSVTPEGIHHDAAFAPAASRVFAASCDERTLSIAVADGAGQGAPPMLASCTYLGGCVPVPLPTFGVGGPPLTAPFAVARSSGVTIIAKRLGGTVRVTSTRDEGRTWGPFVAAFDKASAGSLGTDVAVPERLTVVGRRVLLHGATELPAATYPVLVSDDHGASFRAP